MFSSPKLFELLQNLQLYDFKHGTDSTILFDPPLVSFSLRFNKPIAFELRDKILRLKREEINAETDLIKFKNKKTRQLHDAENDLRDFHSESELEKPNKIPKPKYIEPTLKPIDECLVSKHAKIAKISKALESIQTDQLFLNDNLANFILMLAPALSNEFLIKLIETVINQIKSRQPISSIVTILFQEFCHNRRSSIWPKISEHFSILCPLTEFDIHFLPSDFDIFIRRALLNNDTKLISNILSSPLFSHLILSIVPQVIYSVKDRSSFMKNLLVIAQSPNCQINEHGLSSLVKLCINSEIVGLFEVPQFCIDFITFAATCSNSLIVSQSIFSSVAQYFTNLYKVGSSPTSQSPSLCKALEIAYSKHPNESTVIAGILINSQIARRAIGMSQVIADMKVDIDVHGFSDIKSGSDEWKSLYEFFITKFVCQALNSSDSFIVEYAIEILPSINIEASTLQKTIIPFVVDRLSNGSSIIGLSEQLFRFCVTLCASSDDNSLISAFVSSFGTLRDEFDAIAKDQLNAILGGRGQITNVSLEWSRRASKPYRVIGDALNLAVVERFKENQSNCLQRLSSICKKIGDSLQPLLVLTDSYAYFSDTVGVIGNEHFMRFAESLSDKSEALKHFLVLLGSSRKIEFGREIYDSLKSNFAHEHLQSIAQWSNPLRDAKRMVASKVKKCLAAAPASAVIGIIAPLSPVLFADDGPQQQRGRIVQVRTTTGRIIDVELEPGMTGAQLNAKIARAQGIPESEVRVIDQGNEMGAKEEINQRNIGPMVTMKRKKCNF